MSGVVVKVCGVTSVKDAEACVEAGAQWIGVNFWPGSSRCCEEAEARRIVDAVGASVTVVGVFVDEPVDQLRRILASTGIGWAQLHGHEPPSMLEALLPHAYKALRVGEGPVAEEARRYGGEHVLLDAKVQGMVGGTGQTFDWALAADAARERKLLLAGGLTPDNVADAVEAVAPWAVDVASGVETAPGRKDPGRIRAFVAAARGARRLT